MTIHSSFSAVVISFTNVLLLGIGVVLSKTRLENEEEEEAFYQKSKSADTKNFKMWFARVMMVIVVFH